MHVVAEKRSNAGFASQPSTNTDAHNTPARRRSACLIFRDDIGYAESVAVSTAASATSARSMKI